MGKTKIIDKTVIELVDFYLNNTTEGDSREYFSEAIKKFTLYIKELGGDFQEINLTTILLMGELPSDIDYLFRVKRENDFNVFKKYNFKKGIVNFRDLDILKEYLLDNNLKGDCQWTLEIQGDSFQQILKVLQENKYMEWIHLIDCINIIGLNEELPHKAYKIIKKFRNSLDIDIKLSISIENGNFLATAFSIEAYNNGVEYITTSFCGFDNKDRARWAPLEEVIMGLKFICSMEIECNSRILPEVKGLFQNITRREVKKNKPIIGDNIFKCESGIHVDALNKNPITYEPFDPELIGQSREFLLGKHSGSTGLLLKLDELKLQYKKEDISAMLSRIKDRSISTKVIINNEMIFSIVKEVQEINQGQVI